MKLLAVTCYTGNVVLCEMTEELMRELRSCEPSGVTLQISSTAQGAIRTIESEGVWTSVANNIGFAYGMNEAIKSGADYYGDPDYVLCFNNDLQFPNYNWLKLLTDAAVPDRICVPATDSAAIRVQPGPLPKDSVDVQENSAYCWLVPFEWCKFLKKRYGFWLFSEDFAPGYGEDNWTAFLLSKQFGPKVFRYVPRSFVKHLRGRTSKTVRHDRKRINRILIYKMQSELKDTKIRTDLREWAKRYIAVLSKRS